MIKYDDLLTARYAPHGRGPDEFNCWGMVLECIRRDGKKISDPFKNIERLPAGAEIPYINDFNNIREISRPKAGAIAECLTGPNLHVAYMLTSSLAIHITQSGPHVTHIRALHPLRFYEVLDNESEHN